MAMTGERVLLIGMSPLAARLAEEAAAHPRQRLVILGVVDDVKPGPDAGAGLRHLGPIEALPFIVREHRPDRILVTMHSRRGRLPVEALLAARVRGIAVEDGVEAYERLTGKVAIEALAPSAVIFSREFRKTPLALACRRALSLVAAALGLLVLSPFLLLVALAIRLDSPGPIFFVQDRIGLYGRRFKLLKFRTMLQNEQHASEWVRDNGDRITRLGAWLRKFRVDELPQFVNVLRGDMNLVGPRPHPVCNHQLFLERIPYYDLRSAVRPGITGWAQVRYGYANDLDEETEKMRYDLYYIKHLSFGLDLRIVFQTVSTVLLGRGATHAIEAPRKVTEPGETGRWRALPA